VLYALQALFELPTHVFQGSYSFGKWRWRGNGAQISRVALKHLAALPHLRNMLLLEGKQCMHHIVALDIAAIAGGLVACFEACVRIAADFPQ